MENVLPLVSVLLPVYNNARYVRSSVQSILDQSFKDFEVLLVNDASSDGSAEIVGQFRDSRLRIIHNERNLGLAPSLNRAIAAARSKYLARHDADDIALPHRLETQVQFLEAHPEIAMVGSHALIIDPEGNVTDTWSHLPADDIDIKWQLLFCNPFIHGSVMIRRAVLEETGFYTEDPAIHRAFVEDYDLWSRISRVAKSANIEEPLEKYRLTPTSASARNHSQQVQESERVSRRNICWIAGLDSLDDQTYVAIRRFLFTRPGSEADFQRFEVQRLMPVLEAISENFARRYLISADERRAHFRQTYWLWAKHAIALALKHRGSRRFGCRLTLLASGAGFALKRLWLNVTPQHARQSQNERRCRG